VRGVPENLDAAIATGKAHLVELDIRDREAVATALRGADVVFHQAALRWTRCQEAPRECQEVMVEGTFNVLEGAAAARVRRVVLASSAVVYGDPLRLPLDEDHPTLGGTVYAAAKIANEQMGRAFARLHDIPVVSLRYFNVYGPRQDIRSRFIEVMVRWLDAIDRGEPLTLFGDGSASADFVFSLDVARANLLACESRATDAIVNVCSGVETRMRDLAALILELTGSDVGIQYKPEPPGQLPQRRYGDATRAGDVIGFRAQTGLREGVERLIEWRRAALVRPAVRSAT
jgi:UDP-glucose 4-epimerase